MLPTSERDRIARRVRTWLSDQVITYQSVENILLALDAMGYFNEYKKANTTKEAESSEGQAEAMREGLRQEEEEGSGELHYG